MDVLEKQFENAVEEAKEMGGVKNILFKRLDERKKVEIHIFTENKNKLSVRFVSEFLFSGSYEVLLNYLECKYPEHLI